MEQIGVIKDDEGGIYGVVLPDPIPNSEVKRARADDTAMHVVGKVGSRPLMIEPLLQEGFFL